MILSRRAFLRLLAAVPLLVSVTGAAHATTGGMRKAGGRAEKVHVGAGTQDGVTTDSSGPSDDKGGQTSRAGSPRSGAGAPAGGDR